MVDYLSKEEKNFHEKYNKELLERQKTIFDKLHKTFQRKHQDPFHDSFNVKLTTKEIIDILVEYRTIIQRKDRTFKGEI